MERGEPAIQILATRNVHPQWDRYIAQHPHGSIFHHSLWHKVIRYTYGYDTIYHLVLDGSQIHGAFPAAPVRNLLTGNRLVAYPFSDSCDILANDPEAFNAILSATGQIRKRLGDARTEFRLYQTASQMPSLHWNAQYVTHVINLDKEPKALFADFHKSAIQRSIRKALKNDLEIVFAGSQQELKAFYRLHMITRKKHGVPIQPFAFFRNLWEAFYHKGMMTLLLGKYENRYVAGIIILWLNETGYYKFGASDGKFMFTRVNQLLMWQGIQEAYRRGCRFYDMGRSSLSNKGLIEYKSRWAATQMPLFYFRQPETGNRGILDETSGTHKFANRIIGKFPYFLMRISGKLFYRYFA